MSSRPAAIVGRRLAAGLVLLPLAAAPGAAAEVWKPLIEQEAYHLSLVDGSAAAGQEDAKGGRLTVGIDFRWQSEEAATDPCTTTTFVVTSLEQGDTVLNHGAARAVVEPCPEAPAELPRQPRLVVTIDPDNAGAATLYGTYKAKVETFAGDPSESTSSTLLTLKRAAAVFAAPESIGIERVGYLWLHSLAAPTIWLRRTGGPPAGELVLVQREGAKDGDRGVPGQLTLEADDQAAPAAGLLGFKVSAAKGFPLGEATGTLELISPATADASIEFTILNRQTQLWILLIAAFGITLGFFGRVGLATRIEQGRLLARLGAFQVSMRRQRAGFEEPAFDRALDELDADLNDLILRVGSATTPQEVTTLGSEIDGLKTRLTEAVTAFKEVQKRLADLQAGIAAAIDRTWDLPPWLGQRVKTAGRTLDELAGRIRAGRLTGVEAALGAVAPALTDGLDKEFTAWRRQLQGELPRLGAGQPPLPAAVAGELDRVLKSDLDPLFDKAVDRGEDELANAAAYLSLAHDLQTKSVDLVSRLAADTVATMGLAIGALGPDAASSPEVDRAEKARSALQRLGAHAALADPPDSLQGLMALLTESTGSLKAAILAVAGASPPPGLQKLLTDGEYVRAAREASRRPSPEGLGEEVEKWLLASSATEAASSPRRPAESPAVPDVNLPRTYQEIRRAKLAQTVVVALGLLPIAYLMFADGWVGVPSDWAKVFLWGFTADFGINSLVELAKGQAQP